MRKRTVVVLSSSQPEVLTNYMEEAGMTHNQTVRADIENARIGDTINLSEQVEGVTAQKVKQIFFCGVTNLAIRTVEQVGDNAALPSEVAVTGLKTRKTGHVNLINALITSNGKVTVTADAKTEVVYNNS